MMLRRAHPERLLFRHTNLRRVQLAEIGLRLPPTLEVLYRALMLLGCRARGKRSEVPAPPALAVFLPRRRYAPDLSFRIISQEAARNPVSMLPSQRDEHSSRFWRVRSQAGASHVGPVGEIYNLTGLYAFPFRIGSFQDVQAAVVEKECVFAEQFAQFEIDRIAGRKNPSVDLREDLFHLSVIQLHCLLLRLEAFGACWTSLRVWVARSPSRAQGLRPRNV